MSRNTIISKLSEDDIAHILKVYDSEFIGVCTLSKRVGLHYKLLYKLRDLGLLNLYRSKSLLSKFNICRKDTLVNIRAGYDKWLATGGQKGRVVPLYIRDKIRHTINKKIELGEFIPPCIRYHSSKGMSYAEKYFSDWLTKEGIDFCTQYRVGRYVLDFLIGNIDLEIDGQWHKLIKYVIDKDKRRTAYLLQNGFKVVRVDWKQYSRLNLAKRHEFLERLKLCLLEGAETPTPVIAVKKCPICGLTMHSNHAGITCSKECGKKRTMMTLGTYNADKLLEGESVYDCTFRLYKENNSNYTRTGLILGITGNAVKKRILKYLNMLHE